MRAGASLCQDFQVPNLLPFARVITVITTQ